MGDVEIPNHQGNRQFSKLADYRWYNHVWNPLGYDDACFLQRKEHERYYEHEKLLGILCLGWVFRSNFGVFFWWMESPQSLLKIEAFEIVVSKMIWADNDFPHVEKRHLFCGIPYATQQKMTLGTIPFCGFIVSYFMMTSLPRKERRLKTRMISVPELYVLVSGLSSSFKAPARIRGRREWEDEYLKLKKTCKVSFGVLRKSLKISLIRGGESWKFYKDGKLALSNLLKSLLLKIPIGLLPVWDGLKLSNISKDTRDALFWQKDRT